MELAVRYTSSAQSFRVRNAEKNPVNVNVTQQDVFLLLEDLWTLRSSPTCTDYTTSLHLHCSFSLQTHFDVQQHTFWQILNTVRPLDTHVILHTRNHNSNTTALRRPFATRNAPVEEIPLSLINSFSFKAFCSSDSYSKGLQKEDFDNSSLQLSEDSHSTTLAMLSITKGRAASLQVVQCC